MTTRFSKKQWGAESYGLRKGIGAILARLPLHSSYWQITDVRNDGIQRGARRAWLGQMGVFVFASLSFMQSPVQTRGAVWFCGCSCVDCVRMNGQGKHHQNRRLIESISSRILFPSLCFFSNNSSSLSDCCWLTPLSPTSPAQLPTTSRQHVCLRSHRLCLFAFPMGCPGPVMHHWPGVPRRSSPGGLCFQAASWVQDNHVVSLVLRLHCDRGEPHKRHRRSLGRWGEI